MPGRWQEEETKTSDLVFGVSPTSVGSGFYGRTTQIGSSPYGGVGELLTPPRFHHFMPPGAANQWASPTYSPYHSPHHHASSRPRQPNEGSADLHTLTHRLAATSIDSIDADSATNDGPAVND
jgi:hypothetical protein